MILQVFMPWSTVWLHVKNTNVYTYTIITAVVLLSYTQLIYILLKINQYYDNGLVTGVADPFFQLGQSPVLTFFLLQFPKQTINSVTVYMSAHLCV